ncbi:MAG: TonB-dependent receptor plug domain-containing protein, partial [Bacteroidota bacterium]
MKNYLFKGLIFSLFPLFANAQYVIQGKITDAETGKPIESVYIRIGNSKNAGAISSADGCYKIAIPSAKEVLILSHIGYNTKNILIEKDEDSDSSKSVKMDFNMMPLVSKVSKEVVITSQRADTKSAMVYNEIKSEELSRNNTGRDIPFLLESIPSANITSDAGNGTGYTGLRIRGSDATRINVTIDGIPINDPESQQLYWVNMPDLASSVENIQVQRGAGTSSSGASSFGGGIHITTSRPSTEPFGAASLAAGSFNTQKATFKAGTGTLFGKWNFEARLSKVVSDGYVDRASSDLKSYFLTAGYYGEKHSLRMNMFSGKEVTYQSWYGIPEAALDTNRTFNYYNYENQVDDYQQDHYQLFHSWEFNNKLTLNTAIHYTYGRGFYEEYQTEQGLTDYLLDNVIIGNDTITSTDLIRRKWLDN